jgi:hypothetical protein
MPISNLTCFQETVSLAGIKNVNNLLQSIRSVMNREAQFQVALKRYLNTHSHYSTDEYLMFGND